MNNTGATIVQTISPVHGSINVGISLGAKTSTILPDKSYNKHIEAVFYDNWNPSTQGYDYSNVVAIITFTAAFFFNFILILPFLFFRPVRLDTSNQFIASIALSNFLLSGHLLMFNVILEQFPSPGTMCDFIVYSGVLFSAASNISRCGIAVDRYYFILDPLRYNQILDGTQRVFWFLTTMLIVFTVVIGPYIIDLRRLNEDYDCLPGNPQVYIAFVSVVVVVIPSLIMLVIYLQIFYWAFLQMKILRQEAQQYIAVKNSQETRPSAQGKITSYYMRMYRGSAALLTPDLPFTKTRVSSDRRSSVKEHVNLADRFGTSIDRFEGMVDNLKKSHIRRSRYYSTDIDKAEAVIQTNGPRKIDAEIADTKPIVVDIEENTHQEPDIDPLIVENRARSEGSCIDEEKPTLKVMNTETVCNPDSPAPPLPSDEGQDASGYIPKTQHGEWMKQHLQGNFDVDMNSEPDTSVISLEDENVLGRLYCAELKAVFMVVALLGVFVMCWMPFFVVEVMDMLGYGRVSARERLTCIILIAVNCALDPFTYALMNPPFRMAVIRCVQDAYRKYMERGDTTYKHSAHNKQRTIPFMFVFQPKRNIHLEVERRKSSAL